MFLSDCRILIIFYIFLINHNLQLNKNELIQEKYRGIRLVIRDSGVVLQAHNPEQEEAEEELNVEYTGEDIEIGFNVNYLLDALGAVEGDAVTVSVQDSNSSCLIRQPGNEDCTFVVMPMRL